MSTTTLQQTPDKTGSHAASTANKVTEFLWPRKTWWNRLATALVVALYFCAGEWGTAIVIFVIDIIAFATGQGEKKAGEARTLAAKQFNA